MTSKAAEYHKKWRENNREKHRASRKAWADRNKDKLREYRQKNKEKLYKYSQEWKKKNPERVQLIERRRRLKNKYGITIEQYEELSDKQNHSCAICFSKEKLVVDHDHETNKIRGLLCNDCNRNLIAQRTDPEIFLRAAKYLEDSKIG